MVNLSIFLFNLLLLPFPLPRQVLQNHRCALLDQLDGSLDAPLTLHLACLLLFQSVTGNMLHASGKFVPHILSYVKNSLPVDQFAILQDYQGKEE